MKILLLSLRLFRQSLLVTSFVNVSRVRDVIVEYLSNSDGNSKESGTSEGEVRNFWSKKFEYSERFGSRDSRKFFRFDYKAEIQC